MPREFDCIVCGEVCVDLPVGPVDRTRPLHSQGTLRIEPIRAGTGGIVSNSGRALAKMGLNTAAFGCVGQDEWADVLTRQLTSAGIDTTSLISIPGRCTSVTAIFVDEHGEHTFAFHPGASTQFDRDLIADNLNLFERSGWALFGYYGLLDQVHDDLPALLQRIRAAGCRTALDAAAGGGRMQPLDRILPHLDIYVPSYDEAHSQTGETDPQRMISAFRRHAPSTLLGVKLGADGAILSARPDQWTHVAAIAPPGDIVDTTAAGDCFYAGLLCGLHHRLSVAESGRLAAAAGACAVTGFGTTALPSLPDLCRLANVAV